MNVENEPRRASLFPLLSLIALCALFASGCASSKPEQVVSEVDSYSVVGTYGDVRETTVRSRQGSLVICSGPEPDAAVTHSASAGAGLSILGAGSDRGSAEGSSESADVELVGRTPAILITRELLFRLCELSANHQLSQQQLVELYLKNLEIIHDIASIEAHATSITLDETLESHEDVGVDEKSSEESEGGEAVEASEGGRED